MNDIAIETVRGVVSSDICLFGLKAKSIERVRRAVSYPNPEYTKLRRLKKRVDDVPDMLDCMAELPDGSVRVPRGAIATVKAALARDGVKARFEDERALGEALPEVKLIDGSLREYQHQGVDAIVTYLQGSIILPCGGGKTTVGVAAIMRIGRHTLVIVHTDDLADQWQATLLERTGIRAGRLNATHREIDEPIVIASLWSLVPLLEGPGGDQWVRRFGFAIVDEGHHAPAATFQRALSRIPARYRLNLTATPDREDGLTRMVDWSFGERILEKDVPELVALGYLVLPEVSIVHSELTFEYDGPEKYKMAALTRAITGDVKRNAMIADLAARLVSEGETVLVLSNDRKHCRTLGRLMWERGAEAAVLLGTAGKKKKAARKTTIQSMRDGGQRLAVATSLADEGLDITRLSRVILALPSSSQGRTKQRLGRLTRPFEGKKAVLYDVVDEHVDTLVNRFRQRKTMYRSIGIRRFS